MKKAIITILAVVTAFIIALLTFLAGTGLSPADLRELLGDLPRHNSFQYINRGSLPETWFTNARHSLKDPHVYIVLSNTKSTASKVIARFTGDPYNHISLSFDSALKTLTSFNGGDDRKKPGLNPENVAELQKHTDFSLLVYRIPVKPAQKQRIIEEIGRINAQGSSYNLAGLVTKRSARPNIMFCSQFVYSTLHGAGLDLFEKDSGKVKPMDFVTLVQGQGLALVYESTPENRSSAAEWAEHGPFAYRQKNLR